MYSREYLQKLIDSKKSVKKEPKVISFEEFFSSLLDQKIDSLKSHLQEENRSYIENLVPKKEEVVEMLKPFIPEPIKGEKGDTGETPEPLIPGVHFSIPKDGLDGKDGKSVSKKEMVRMLQELLDEKEGLKEQDVQEMLDKTLEKHSTTLNNKFGSQLQNLRAHVDLNYGGHGGSGGSSGTQVYSEAPSGSGTTFTIVHTPTSGTLRLFRGGARQQAGVGNDYTLSGATITLATSLSSGEILLADYTYA